MRLEKRIHKRRILSAQDPEQQPAPNPTPAAQKHHAARSIISSSKKQTNEDDRQDGQQTNQSVSCVHVSFQCKHLVIILYICIWAFFYLLVHHSSDNIQDKTIKSGVIYHAIFNTCVELIKMTFSIALFLRSYGLHEFSSFFHYSNRKMMSLSLQYLPVAILYALYNNLMFFNLKSNHPSVYLVLSNSRLVMTAFAWQLVFNVRILHFRKVAILFILVGILARDIVIASVGEKAGRDSNDARFFFTDAGTILILVQMTCSVLASVYNEKMLKTNNCNWLLQNISLYINSVVINLVIIASSAVFQVQNDEIHIGLSEMRSLMSSPTSILIVLTMATGGIIASMVLRHVDSVTKNVAGATTMVLTSLLEYFFFEHYFMAPEIIGIVLVSAGSVLYNIPASTLIELLTKRESDSINVGIKRSSSRTMVKLLLFTVFFIAGFGLATHTQLSFSADTLAEKERLHKAQTQLLFSADTLTEKERLQLQKVSKAEEVLAYIVSELDKINAPVALMYGTMLHEYRNGTGPTVLPNVKDKDFDIAVSKEHFHHIIGMFERIEEKFGYCVKYVSTKKLMIVLTPPGQELEAGFQIDIYGFKVLPSRPPLKKQERLKRKKDIYDFDLDRHRPELIFFPWDMVFVAMNGFLPLVKYKPLSVNATASVLGGDEDHRDLHYYMPYNVPCLLANIYGDDYMTPTKEGESFFWRSKAFDHPRCDNDYTASEREELKRQLSF